MLKRGVAKVNWSDGTFARLLIIIHFVADVLRWDATSDLRERSVTQHGGILTQCRKVEKFDLRFVLIQAMSE